MTTQQDYRFALTDLRAGITSGGKRYARVRAIANGPDSYNSVFTENARQSIIAQIKSNAVGTKALHRDDVYSNVSQYLEMRSSMADAEEKRMLETLKGQLPLARYPIGKSVDAQFIDDNTIEVLIEENDVLARLGTDEKEYLDANWSMIQDGIIRGVSVAFNSVKTFVQDGKTFIDDLILTGLDFVDKAAHPQTQVIETFMRAAQQKSNEKMTETDKPKEPNTGKPEPEPTPAPVAQPKHEGFKSVDDMVEDKVKQQLAIAEQKKAEAEALDKKESDYKSKIQALETERKEAIEIAREAVEKLKTRKETVVHKTNPLYDSAAQQSSDKVTDPFAGKSIAELMALAGQIPKQ